MPDLFGNTNAQNSLPVPVEKMFDKSHLRMTTNEDGEVIYCFSDVLAMATGTSNPRKEMANVKKALEKQGIQLCQVMAHVKFRAKDGKLYTMWGGTRQQIFRALQEVRSPRLAPFKKWLSYAGDEYLKEQENPDLAIQRGYEGYLKKGFTPKHAMLRAKSILHRKHLTEQWSSHGITTPREFALLTDRESKGVFGKTTGEMKKDRNLPASANLRDKMNVEEITAQDVADVAISLLIDKRNPYGYAENCTEVDKGSAVGARLLADLQRTLEA